MHEKPLRPGFTFDGGRLNDFCLGMPCVPDSYAQQRWLEGQYEYYDDVWGNIWVRMKDGCAAGEIYRPAIFDWSDLGRLQIPYSNTPMNRIALTEKFKTGPDKFKVYLTNGWIFATSRYMRKMDSYLMDLALEQDKVMRLHSFVAEAIRSQITLAGECGSDAIFFCEDMGTQTGLLISPSMWQFFFEEMYRELFGLAHEYGMKVIMHSCGKNDEILPGLLNVGVDCFQLDQLALYDLDALRSLLKKHKACVWSPIDIQKVLPTGDFELIRKAANEMVQVFNGMLIVKNYSDLPGIGVKPEWDEWGYQCLLDASGML